MALSASSTLTARAALDKARGDVSLRGVRGKVACDQVNGQLHLVEVGEVAIRRVMGDLTAENIRGALELARRRTVGGRYAKWAARFRWAAWAAT